MTTYSPETVRPATTPAADFDHQTERRSQPYATSRDDDRTFVGRDRIRWGPVWAGLVVAVSTYLLLQLALVAFGVVDLVEPTTTDAVASAVAAFVAFLLGGMIAGATAMWRGVDDGILHGVVLWAVGLVALVVLSAAGSGLALGSIDTTQAFDQLSTQNVDRVQAGEQAQDAAAKAALGITVALAAAAIGGLAGARMWPRRDDDDDNTVDLRTTPRGA